MIVCDRRPPITSIGRQFRYFFLFKATLITFCESFVAAEKNRERFMNFLRSFDARHWRFILKSQSERENGELIEKNVSVSLYPLDNFDLHGTESMSKQGWTRLNPQQLGISKQWRNVIRSITPPPRQVASSIIHHFSLTLQFKCFRPSDSFPSLPQ